MFILSNVVCGTYSVVCGLLFFGHLNAPRFALTGGAPLGVATQSKRPLIQFGLIPAQGTYLGCGFGPQSGHV